MGKISISKVVQSEEIIKSFVASGEWDDEVIFCRYCTLSYNVEALVVDHDKDCIFRAAVEWLTK